MPEEESKRMYPTYNKPYGYQYQNEVYTKMNNTPPVF